MEKMESIGENIYIFKHFQNGVGEYRLIVYGCQNSKVAPRFLTLLVCTPCINPSPWMGLVNMMKAFKRHLGISLVVQWLRLHASTAGDAGWIPGWEAKIPIMCCTRGHKKKTSSHCERWMRNWLMTKGRQPSTLKSLSTVQKNPPWVSYCLPLHILLVFSSFHIISEDDSLASDSGNEMDTIENTGGR